ncbi:MAG: hypothetical protein BWY70_00319 [Bacteroidetes bacterium ADurb.Bin408]|nr:MAG: hypothetical protein BWY70_00319 [Bacteroidetes bacterium ADurb.Bin408]
MIQIDSIRNFFPAHIQHMPVYQKYMLKEYIQLQILEFLSTTKYIKKLAFIGGTYLRLVKGIDRFSEDLDFDCKCLSEAEFVEMNEMVLAFLKRNGYAVDFKDSDDTKLRAFRSSLYFPELLFELGLTGHKEERFMIKIESQDQEVHYKSVITHIKGCGFFFPFPVPPNEVICAMKIAAMISRRKGRDFYDVMFLLSQIKPDFNFLNAKCGIKNMYELKSAVGIMLQTTDLKIKMKDFEHLLFNKENSRRILQFTEFIEGL